MPRAALRILQLGAIAIVIAATTHRGFDLDRFLVPKELVLHATAALAGIFAIGLVRNTKATRIDTLLAIYLLLSAISALFATNHWLAARALAISISGAVVFWVARSIRNAGPLLNAIAIAVVIAAVLALLQAYGIWLDLFSANRAPGGTLGNRNFVAHAAAFGMPVVLLAAFRDRLLASAGVPILTATLVLTRSRAAWLAFTAAAVVFFVAMLASSALRRDARTWRRLLFVLVLVGIGVAAALLIPNDLKWRSDNPYLESAKDVVNYQEGSGRGRLIQYERSLRMAARHPIFGVGPGNWAVVYPDHVPASDPSIDTSEGGMTFNPWPSSDWVAFASERGFAAAIVLALVFAGMAFTSMKRVKAATESDEALLAATLLSTLVAAGVAGAFDAVLMLALPAFIVWATAGALMPREIVAEPIAEPVRTSPLRSVLVVILSAIAGLAAVRSAGQIAAMELLVHGDRPSLRRAAMLDPGNYRVHMRLARGGKDRCAHALAARDLYPHADAARAAARGCGD